MDIARNVMNCQGVLHAINRGANAGDDFACNTCASANGRCARHAPSSSDPCLLTRRERVPLHRHDIACNTATVQFYMVGPSDPICHSQNFFWLSDIFQHHRRRPKATPTPIRKSSATASLAYFTSSRISFAMQHKRAADKAISARVHEA